jgi:hypothetical protein
LYAPTCRAMTAVDSPAATPPERELVADFTGARTGVFFEAGIGVGLDIPVVFTCRADRSAELEEHFDTRQYNHLLWKDPSDLHDKLRLRIEATVTARPSPRR